MAIAAAAAGVAVAGAVAGGVLGAKAAKKQESKQKKAIKNVNQFRQRVLEFQQQIYDDSQPFRDISLAEAQRGQSVRDQTIPYLLSDLLSEDQPGERGYGKDFDLASKEGLDAIQRNFATSGSPSSGAAQIAAGRFTSGLVASEEQRRFARKEARINNIFRLSGLGGVPSPTTGIGESLSALNIGQQSTQDLAGLQVQLGAVQAGRYQNYANMAQQLGSIGSSYLGGGGFGGGGFSGFGGFGGAGSSGGGAINAGGFSGLSVA